MSVLAVAGKLFHAAVGWVGLGERVAKLVEKLIDPQSDSERDPHPNQPTMASEMHKQDQIYRATTGYRVPSSTAPESMPPTTTLGIETGEPLPPPKPPPPKPRPVPPPRPPRAATPLSVKRVRDP